MAPRDRPVGPRAPGVAAIVAAAVLVVVAASAVGGVPAGAAPGAVGWPADSAGVLRARSGGGRVEVAAAFFPLAWAAARVGGERVEVADLTPTGAEPHDLELSPQGVDRVLDADLAVVLGGGFQPAVEAAAARRDGPTLTLLGGRRGVAGRDPHIWLDPVLMGRVVDRVAGTLAEVDPAHAGGYRRRATALRAELGALDAEYRAGLADCARRLLVTSHEAFGRMARRYDLRQEGVVGRSPDAEPDPARLGALADRARRAGATTVFTETVVSPRIARTLAREAGGLRTAVLDPLESRRTGRDAPAGDYLAAMRTNLATLRAGLGCR